MIKGECYICTLETDQLSKCKCKKLFLHKECNQNIIKSNHKFTCSICNEEYENINILLDDINKIKIRTILIYIFLEIIFFLSFIIICSLAINF